MKEIYDDYEDQYFDRIMDMIYDDSVYIGYSLNDKKKALEIARALKNPLEKQRKFLPLKTITLMIQLTGRNNNNV